MSSTTYSGFERGMIVLRSSNRVGECQWDSWELVVHMKDGQLNCGRGLLRVSRFSA